MIDNITDFLDYATIKDINGVNWKPTNIDFIKQDLFYS